MDILILNWKDIKNPEVGGAEVIAFEFARRLVKDGHTVTFFSRSFNNAKPQEELDGVKIVRRGNKLSVYLHAFFYYRQRKVKPDRVIDMINTLCWQTPLYVPSTKRIAYINQLAKEVLFYEFPKPISWIAYFLERFEYLPYKNSRFLCYSESTKEDLQTFGIPKGNIRTFPLGMDHERYVQGRKKAEHPQFVFVARLVRMKRPELCIRAMKEVTRSHSDAKLFIIGNGPEEERLVTLVQKLQLGKHVFFVNKNNFFIDKNPNDQKIALMQESWALLLPSVKEGWGMVVTEAAACGTPAIVSRVTGLVDSVLDNKTGLVLSKNPSPQELANAMKTIIENKRFTSKISKRAVKWAREFSWDKSYIAFRQMLLQKNDT